MTHDSMPLPPSNPLRCSLCIDAGLCDLESDTSEQRLALDAFLARLRALVESGGPLPEDYDQIVRGLRSLDLALGDCGLRQRHICKIREALGDAMSTDTMQGFSLAKPYGYAGDFDIIDRIYMKRVSADPKLTRWDLFYHAQQAPTAVRNRAAYFSSLLHSLTKSLTPDVRHIRVLNVASGPGRDMYNYFAGSGDTRVHFDCVEADVRAIQYATRVCELYMDNITFVQSNALRFSTNVRYDLVWSAGLFDYFSDRVFTRLMTRLARMVKPGCQLVIGNFSADNASRSYMELVGEWSLNHRSAEHLVALAAGITPRPLSIKVDREESGLNLFLRLEPDNGDHQPAQSAAQGSSP